jgi:hypothetical protein
MAARNGRLWLSTIGMLACMSRTGVERSASPTVARPLATAAHRNFHRVLLLEEKGETSANVAVGDLNGDAYPDIVLAKGRHWPLHDRVLLNDGKGNFPDARDLAGTPDRTYAAVLADLDTDGDLDLVVSNDAPDRKLVYRNDGKAHFELRGSFGDPSWPTRNIAVADLDGRDGPDVVVANRGRVPRTPVHGVAPSFVCFNDGKGGFPVCRPLPTESATTIVATDLDGDGAADLAVPHRDGGANQILWNDGRGEFPNVTVLGGSKSSARTAAAGDLDGNGFVDLVVGDEGRRAFFYPNSGKRAFATPVALATKDRIPYALAIGDLNRDGKPDIVVGYVRSAGSIFWNEGGMKFRESRWNDGQGAVYGMALADLDGDGWLDIAAARSDAPNGVWFSADSGSGGASGR